MKFTPEKNGIPLVQLPIATIFHAQRKLSPIQINFQAGQVPFAQRNPRFGKPIGIQSI